MQAWVGCARNPKRLFCGRRGKESQGVDWGQPHTRITYDRPTALSLLRVSSSALQQPAVTRLLSSVFQYFAAAVVDVARYCIV
jgi:hypothetical protein